MKKQVQARLKLVEMLDNQETRIIRALQETSDLIKERQYAYASGSLEKLLWISTELSHQVEILMTQQFKKIFQAEPQITQSYDDIVEKKNKALEWIAVLKKAAIQLQQVLHDTVKGTIDISRILDCNMKLHEVILMDRSLAEFLSLSRNIFVEYSIWEQRELIYKDEIQEIYKRLKIHLRIRKVSEKLFKDGHYRNAILDSFIEIEKMTREKSGSDEIGERLYGTIFNPSNPKLRLNTLEEMEDKDEQRGFMHIFMGASIGIRNPKAHDTFIQKDAYRTLEYLCLASLLAKRIDESKT